MAPGFKFWIYFTKQSNGGKKNTSSTAIEQTQCIKTKSKPGVYFELKNIQATRSFTAPDIKFWIYLKQSKTSTAPKWTKLLEPELVFVC